MAYPEDLLNVGVHFLLGDTWTDVSSDVQWEQRINISHGRSNYGQDVDTSTCSFRLNNTTGDYSPENPNGQHFGNLDLGTRVRVVVDEGDVALLLSGDNAFGDFVSTPDAASLDITGDIDIRVEGSLVNWVIPDVPGSEFIDTIEIVGKALVGQYSWLLGSRNGALFFEWAETVAGSLRRADSTIAPVPPGPGDSMAVRVTMDVDNGASGRTITFYTSDSIDGTWEQLGDPVVQSGTTSIANSTSPVRIGDASNVARTQPVGRIRKVEVRDGIGGTVVTNPDFTAQASGATSFNDGAGLTWTVSGEAEITNRSIRFFGEVSDYELGVTGGRFPHADIQAAGIIRRIDADNSPSRSALFREFTNPEREDIVGYWPMEDPEGSTSVAPGLVDGRTMVITPSGITLGDFSDYAASDPLPTFTTGRAYVLVPPHDVTGEINARFFVAVPGEGVTGERALCSLFTTGTAREWRVLVNSSGSLALRAYDGDNAEILDSGFGGFLIGGKQRMIGVELTENGSDVDWALKVFILEEFTYTSSSVATNSGTLVSRTVGRANSFRVGDTSDLNGTAIGHLVVANQITAFANTTGAMVGWKGERMSERAWRLGSEEGFFSYAVGETTDEVGNQGAGTIMGILRRAAQAEGGILSEQREVLGLRYRGQDSLGSQPPALTLPYDSDVVNPFRPKVDDLDTANVVTVTRTSGSSSTVEQTEGSRSIQTPPNGIGRRELSEDHDLFRDEQTLHSAGWLLHLGTGRTSRLPSVTVQMARIPAQISAVKKLYLGDVIKLTDLPSWMAPDELNLMVQGYTETIDQFMWNITFNCTDANAFRTWWIGHGDEAYLEREFSWIDPDDIELAEALDTTETGVDILTNIYPTGTDDVGDMPFDLRTGGEVIRVVAPGGLVNANPFFDTDTTGWAAQNGTIARATTQVHPLGVASLQITPDGVSAFVAANSDMTATGSITPGAEYQVSTWVYSELGTSSFEPVVNWHTAAAAYISTTGIGGGPTIPAGVWTYVTQTLAAPATASRAVLRLRMNGTPSSSDILHTWGSRICRLKASAVYDTFEHAETDTWGVADSGQSWTNTGGVAADYDVGSGYGTHINQAVSTGHHSVIAAPNADTDVYCDITAAALSTGASQFAGILARYTDADNLYEARVEFDTSNAITLSIRERVSAVEAQLGTYAFFDTLTAGTFIRVRFQVVGTALKAKIWRVTDPEPDAWAIEVTDSSLTAAGSTGVKSVRDAGNTNSNAELRFDNFEMVNPQTFSVERSVNTVVKSHSAGAAVTFNVPNVFGL